MQLRRENRNIPVGVRRVFMRSEKSKVQRHVVKKNPLTEDQMDIEKYLGRTLIEETNQ